MFLIFSFPSPTFCYQQGHNQLSDDTGFLFHFSTQRILTRPQDRDKSPRTVSHRCDSLTTGLETPLTFPAFPPHSKSSVRSRCPSAELCQRPHSSRAAPVPRNGPPGKRGRIETSVTLLLVTWEGAPAVKLISQTRDFCTSQPERFRTHHLLPLAVFQAEHTPTQ